MTFNTDALVTHSNYCCICTGIFRTESRTDSVTETAAKPATPDAWMGKKCVDKLHKKRWSGNMLNITILLPLNLVQLNKVNLSAKRKKNQLTNLRSFNFKLRNLFNSMKTIDYQL